MPPHVVEKQDVPVEDEKQFPKLKAPHADDWKFRISYFNVLAFGYWHAAALYGLYLAFTSAKWATIIFSFFTLITSTLGVTTASHRLYSHKAFKAKLPLEILLMLMNTLAGQYSIHNWVRDHRMHHKYSDTDADPHNATRGFFFSHIGWLLVEKHPELKKRGGTVDLSDIESNPVLAFQKKYAAPWFTLMCYILPTVIPMYYWGETLSNAWHLNILRHILCLNGVSLINSAAHLYGNKPYDKSIAPKQNNLVVISALGEGFHNYHHVFPWDYRAAEFGNYTLNLTTHFINFFAWIGWAYDLKTVDPSLIKARAERTGDGSYKS